MSRKVIVAIAGVALAGKDTFAAPLMKIGFQHGSFAHNLKEMCQEIFNLPPSLTDTQDGKKKRLDVPRRLNLKNLTAILRWMNRTHELVGKADVIENIKKKFIIDPTNKTGKPLEFGTAREILQLVGTEICREIISTYHIDVLINKIRNSPEGKWVITDARFENEREALRELGALTVLIKRPGLTTNVPTHISETSLGSDEEYDLVVVNDGTIDELQDKSKVFTKL